MEHRLFGTAGPAWSVSTHSSWVVMERAGWVLGCLTRCWVLRVRAHRHAISVAGGDASASRPSAPTVVGVVVRAGHVGRTTTRDRVVGARLWLVPTVC